MKKQILICADDFAQNEEISEGILTLMQMKRINATSCMVNGACWPDMATGLHAMKSTHFIGLHLNFSLGQPLSAMWRKHVGEVFPSLKELIKRIYLKRLNSDVVMAEIQAQLDVFTHTMHVYPDFLDGHQHVQQLPIIRQALLEIHSKQMGHIEPENTPFLRTTNNGFRDYFSLVGFPKPQILALLGGRLFKRTLNRDYISTNTSFAGIYRFKEARQYRRYFQKFLEITKDGGLIMCHPGNASSDMTDPLHLYREHELDYFMSDPYLTDMEDNAFQLMKKQGDVACF